MQPLTFSVLIWKRLKLMFFLSFKNDRRFALYIEFFGCSWKWNCVYFASTDMQEICLFAPVSIEQLVLDRRKAIATQSSAYWKHCSTNPSRLDWRLYRSSSSVNLSSQSSIWNPSAARWNELIFLHVIFDVMVSQIENMKTI